MMIVVIILEIVLRVVIYISSMNSIVSMFSISMNLLVVVCRIE